MKELELFYASIIPKSGNCEETIYLLSRVSHPCIDGGKPSEG
jgi:hypothetical protein